MSLLSVHCDANTRRWMTENEARGFKGTLVMMHIGNGQCGPECHGMSVNRGHGLAREIQH